jgi:hypothetical protein
LLYGKIHVYEIHAKSWKKARCYLRYITVQEAARLPAEKLPTAPKKKKELSVRELLKKHAEDEKRERKEWALGKAKGKSR